MGLNTVFLRVIRDLRVRKSTVLSILMPLGVIKMTTSGNILVKFISLFKPNVQIWFVCCVYLYFVGCGLCQTVATNNQTLHVWDISNLKTAMKEVGPRVFCWVMCSET